MLAGINGLRVFARPCPYERATRHDVQVPVEKAQVALPVIQPEILQAPAPQQLVPAAQIPTASQPAAALPAAPQAPTAAPEAALAAVQETPLLAAKSVPASAAAGMLPAKGQCLHIPGVHPDSIIAGCCDLMM